MIYRNLFLIFILLFKEICIVYSEPVILKLLVNTVFDNEGASHRKLVNEFNEKYAIVNNLNAKIYIDAKSTENSSSDIRGYGDTFSSALRNKRNKYDIIHFYSAYSKKYGDYFEDLSSYLAEEFKDYDKELLKNTCTNKDGKLVGLPFSLLMNVLYSNTKLLNKYGKTPPKTWQELIETSKYIYDEELKEKNIITRFFNPLNEKTSGSLSIHEFINSFRESNESPTPPLKSIETIEALQTLKNMTLEMGVENFKSEYSLFKLFNFNSTLFMNFSYTMHDESVFMTTALPGNKANVTGTIINTANFGINKSISEERKRLSVEFLKFIALKEIQMKYAIKDQFFLGNTKLYENNDFVCKFVQCDILENIKPFSYFNNDERFFGNDDYFPRYQGLLKYIYENDSITDVIQRLDDFTKIYELSLKTDDSIVGIILFIVFLFILICITLSTMFIFIKKLENKFIFLSKNLWVITTLGTLILLSSIITLYGRVTNAKCHLRITLINMGFVLSICPSLHKLITNFPKRNKISSMFKINKYITIVIIMLFTLALNEVYAMTTYSIKEIIPFSDKYTFEEGKHFNICVMNNTFGNIIYYIIQFFNFFIILISLTLIFIEWNLKETALDVKYLATALFMDTLSLIILIIFEKVVIKDYIVYNVILAVNIMVFAVSNHIFIYLVRVLPIFRPDDSFEDSRKILGKISSSNNRTLPNSSYNKHSNSSSSSFTKGSMAYYSNLANSHYSNTGTSIYNNIGTSSYNNMGVSSYNNNINSSNKYPSKSNSSSASSGTRRDGFTRRIMEIMDYHNQTYIK